MKTKIKVDTKKSTASISNLPNKNAQTHTIDGKILNEHLHLIRDGVAPVKIMINPTLSVSCNLNSLLDYLGEELDKGFYYLHNTDFKMLVYSFLSIEEYSKEIVDLNVVPYYSNEDWKYEERFAHLLPKIMDAKLHEVFKVKKMHYMKIKNSLIYNSIFRFKFIVENKNWKLIHIAGKKEFLIAPAKHVFKNSDTIEFTRIEANYLGVVCE